MVSLYRSAVLILFIGIGILHAQTDSLNVDWQANSESNVVEYHLFRSVNGGDFKMIKVLRHPLTHYTDKDGIEPGNEYEYAVTAVNDAGDASAMSERVGVGLPQIQWHVQNIGGDAPTRVTFSSFLKDPDTDVSRLKISVSRAQHVEVSISNGGLNLSPEAGYTGSGSITVTATDPAGFWDQKTVSFNIASGEVPVETADKMIVYPNPFRPGDGHTVVIFENIPAEASRITIFTPNGDLMYSQDINGQSTGRWEWNVMNDKNQALASGLYIYIVEGKNGQKLISGKLAVIR